MKKVMVPDTPTKETKVKEHEKAEEMSGMLEFQSMEDKLMHSVMENDQDIIDKGKLLNEAMNQNLSAFSPDMMMQKMVSNYKLAKQIYGPKLIQALSGYDEKYIEKNMHIPEFQRELKQKMTENIEELKDKKLIDRQDNITEAGIELAALVSFVQEIDNLKPKGYYGEKFHKKRNIYGDKNEVRNYSRGDRFRDIAIRKTVKTAIRRRRTDLVKEDLKSFERESKGEICIIYAVDSSASMKGDKIDRCKKAGIALAYSAINEKDQVGRITFSISFPKTINPT